ncbi:MAG: hypothetical protein L6R40_000939 [Gallowayella cf. fulva]|nr:MAG: hypothetical protein L6R40_000939 [Xanthomendoza cf. fulva]
MSPAKRHSLHLDLPDARNEGLPQIAALFLIRFGVKAGYMIGWAKSIPGLDIADSVEYKSLPSGIHNVPGDTIYFIHDDQYAGISSFIKRETEESERNAVMLAVGALIPLSYGRLGKSWRHAERLRTLAENLVEDPRSVKPLEEFWQEYQHREDDGDITPTSGEGSPSALKDIRRRAKSSPNGQPRTRNRAISSASALAPPGQTLSSHHPALSLSTFLDTFGPLVFPLHRAALLRKRILLISQAPVELSCNFGFANVYNISILSTLPSALHPLLPLSPLPTRLRPLFSIGVHDIPTLTTGSRDASPQENLAAEGQAYGWVACTTDGILGTKDHLYDTIVTLPASSSPATETQSNKFWPKIQGKKGVDVRATQRDARRYRVLRQDLQSHHSSSSSRPPSSQQPTERYTDAPDSESDTSPLLPLPTDPDPPPPEPDQTDILEPQSWSALAYNSFIWWASAGETRTDREEEEEYDSSLLANIGRATADTPSSPGLSRGRREDGGGSPEGEKGVGFEMALIGYFHRLTVLMLRTLSDVVDASDDGDGTGRDGDGAGEVVVEIDDMTRMGLDIWSMKTIRAIKPANTASVGLLPPFAAPVKGTGDLGVTLAFGVKLALGRPLVNGGEMGAVVVRELEECCPVALGMGVVLKLVDGFPLVEVAQESLADASERAVVQEGSLVGEFPLEAEDVSRLVAARLANLEDESKLVELVEGLPADESLFEVLGESRLVGAAGDSQEDGSKPEVAGESRPGVGDESRLVAVEDYWRADGSMW